MIRSFKYRLYPNKFQVQKLENVLELCRWLYNSALEQKKYMWKYHKKSISFFKQTNEIPSCVEQVPELKEVYSQTLREVLKRVDKTFSNFFREIKRNSKTGFPRFKSKDRYHSFTYPQNANNAFKIVNNKLKLSKIGSIKIKKHREIKGQIKNCTIIKKNDKWYVSFQVDIGEVPNKKPIKNSVGIDLGMKNFATLDNGDMIENPKYLKKSLDKIKQAQQKLSSKKKGSNNRKKCKKVLSRLHEKVNNQRQDFLHKLSHEIVGEYDLICYEDLTHLKQNVKDKYGKHFNRTLNDTTWNIFTGMLLYKAEEAGKIAISVHPAYTTQMCSSCGEIIHKALHERTHKCNCGLELDRDVNAAINIKRLGTNLVSSDTKLLH